MDSNPRSTGWRSILIIIFSLGGSALTISSAIGILIFLAINTNFVLDANLPQLATVLVASTLIVIGLLLLPVAWLSLQRLRGLKFDSLVLPPLRLWAWISIPGLWILVMVLATLYYDAPGASWYVPFLHFLSIALPIYLVIRIGANRIPLGSSQRAWGVFGIGMTLAPLLAVIAEFTMIALGIAVVAVYLGFNPDKMVAVEQLVNQVEQASDLDSLVYTVGPLLQNPLTLLTALAFLSFLVPVIEETAKSLGVWLVADRLKSPAQGFALGILSGAGFALAESLSASLTADNSWAVTLTTRAISGSMHMLATGLFGWGIAYARLEKRYLRLVGMSLLAILLHATWNAGVIFSVAGGVRVMLTMPDFDLLGSLLTIGGAGLLFVLTSGMVLSFFILNWRLRGPAQPPVQQEMVEASGSTNEVPNEMGKVK